MNVERQWTVLGLRGGMSKLLMALKLLVHCMASVLVESFLNVFATLGHDLFLLAVSFLAVLSLTSLGHPFCSREKYNDTEPLVWGYFTSSAWGNHEFSVVVEVEKTLKFLWMEPSKAFCLKVKFHLRKGTCKSKYTASFCRLSAILSIHS